MLTRVFHFGRQRQAAWLVALAMLLGLTAPVLAQAPAKPDAGKVEAYRLGPGDKVAITVSPLKGWDSDGQILPDGSLYLDHVGKVQAAGMTVDQLQEHVHKALSKELRNHRVLVKVTERAEPPPPPMEKPVKPGRVTVTGAVLKPGEVELDGKVHAFKAISIAGGATKEADLANVVILHRDLTRTVVDLSTDERIADKRHNLELVDGDSIQIKELPAKVAGSVRISGEVQSPGLYDYKPGMTLEDLIAAAKPTQVSDFETIQFQRMGQELKKVNLYERQEQGIAGKVTLQAGDEVLIDKVKDRVMLIGMLINAKPGPRKFIPGQTLREFFLDPNGDQNAALNDAVVDMGNVKVIRAGKELAKVNLKDVIGKENSKDNVALQSGDVIFLPSKRQPKRDFLDYLGGLGPLSLLFGL